VSEAGGIVSLAAAGLRAQVQLDPFGIAWHRDGEDAPFLRDRPTQAYLLSRKNQCVAARDGTARRRTPLRARR